MYYDSQTFETQHEATAAHDRALDLAEQTGGDLVPLTAEEMARLEALFPWLAEAIRADMAKVA